MDCNTTIGLDSIIRSALRVNEGCAAVSVSYGIIDETAPCEPLPLLTIIAMASADTSLLWQAGALGTTPPTCDELRDIPTEQLIRHVLLPADGNTYVFETKDAPDPPVESCEQDCDLEPISTEALIRGTFVKCPGCNNGWALQVMVVSDPGAWSCADTELSTETLLRMCIVACGDGTYAWRVAQI